jgi:hypothetical protein
MLKGAPMNRMWDCGFDADDSRQGPVTGSCGHDIEPSEYTNIGEFFVELSSPQQVHFSIELPR